MKVNARDWSFELNTGTVALPVWTEIGEINTMTLSRSKEDTDTTVFDSNGNAEHEVMQRGQSFTIEGFYGENPADGVRDAGQAAVEALADATGIASLKQVRVTSPGGTTKTFLASAEVGDVGGGNNDKTSWSATFTRSGATTTA